MGPFAYFGAYDVHRAQLIGTIAPTTGIAPFGELVSRVMTAEPYAFARRVCWVVDTGSSHAGAASIRRMAEAWPTVTLVHLPVPASWLNQIGASRSVNASGDNGKEAKQVARSDHRKPLFASRCKSGAGNRQGARRQAADTGGKRPMSKRSVESLFGGSD